MRDRVAVTFGVERSATRYSVLGAQYSVRPTPRAPRLTSLLVA